MLQHTYKQKTYRQANFVLTWLLSILSGLSIGLAYFYKTWLWSISISLVTFFLFVILTNSIKNSRRTYLLGAIALAIFGWLFVYELNFAIESYFFFFLGAMILILYQNSQVGLLYTFLVVCPQSYMYYTKILHGKHSVEALFLGALPIVLMLITGLICAIIENWIGYISYQNHIQIQQAEEKIKSLQTSMDWIMQISEGELSTMNDQMLYGIMGGSRLIDMKNKLIQAKALEEKEKFMNIGIGQIAEVISDHDYDLDELAKNILKKVVTYFEAEQGSFYLLESHEDTEVLVLKAAYACNPEKHNRHILVPNEGFVGQALQTGSILQIEDVPDNFFQISSGLGGMKPKAIYAIPIQTHEETVGVIELATLKPFESYKIELLEKITESVASSILSINFNNTTTQLLMESRDLATRLQSQEEQIKQHLNDYETQLLAKQREIDALKATR